jgi:hypothetical protein
MSRTYGTPKMTGGVLGWLLVCDPVEQTAAQLGERADRFRLRPGAWEDQVRNRDEAGNARALIALGLQALAGAPAARRARLEELGVFYTWWESRMDSLWDEWQTDKREHVPGGDDG